MPRENTGLITIYKKVPAFPDYFIYHCVLQSESSMCSSDRYPTRHNSSGKKKKNCTLGPRSDFT